MYAGRGERVVARDHDRPPAVQAHAWPGFEADSTEDADMSRGFVVEEFQILWNAPRQATLASDHAILRAGDDEMEQFGHERERLESRRNHSDASKVLHLRLDSSMPTKPCHAVRSLHAPPP